MAPDDRSFPWDRVFVAGAGLSGMAAASWALDAGAGEVVLSDIAPLDQWDPTVVADCRKKGITIDSSGHDLSLLRGVDLLIPSPGIPSSAPLIQKARNLGIDIIGELALGVMFWDGPVVGITGTNGKTTTTLLISHLLQTAGINHVTGGNCAPPLLSLMQHNSGEAVAVVEVSSFQLDSFPNDSLKKKLGGRWPRFHVALLLNLAYDHLDRYPSLDEYGKSKGNILKFQEYSDWTILPHRDRGLDFWQPMGRGRRLYFQNLSAPSPRDHTEVMEPDRLPGAWFENDKDTIVVSWHDGGTESYDIRNWPLFGDHNKSNLAAAILASRLVGAGINSIQEGIEGFQGLPHRMELVMEQGGIRFINDSKATNVAATLAALETLPPPLVVIMGGRGKGEVYDRLSHAAARGLFQGAVLIGEEGPKLEKALAGYVRCTLCREKEGDGAMAEAVRTAVEMLPEEGTVLLSPACASFDLFANYQARGDAFKKAVEEYAA